MNRTSTSVWVVLVTVCAFMVMCPVASSAQNARQKDGKLRIIAFGAHPDDCEWEAGGVAAKWADMGHHVKFVAMTNGDIGHWKMAGGPLAQRRKQEILNADKILGVETVILDNHDGELLPTLENRKTIVRLIREWKADIVLCHRTNDYHPDHRYSAILVQDAAYMVTVPFFCPDTPHLARNPVFLYFSDNFQKPNPFQPDIVVSIDDVINLKVRGLVDMESQFVERGVSGSEALMWKTEAEHQKLRQQESDNLVRRCEEETNRYRDKLIELYGEEKGKAVRTAEAFEICEYGRRPNIQELKKLFPFF